MKITLQGSVSDRGDVFFFLSEEREIIVWEEKGQWQHAGKAFLTLQSIP